MLKSLRGKLFTIFVCFSFLSLSIYILHNWCMNERKKLTDIQHHILDIQTLLLQDSKMVHDFFTYETKNSTFFTTKKSKYLNKHQLLSDSIIQKTRQLTLLPGIELFDITSAKDSLLGHYHVFNANLDSIITYILQRGFKDDGTEGLMRENIHKLEEIPNIQLAEVLMLRRHEKDYIIRNEQKYIDKLTKRQHSFKNLIILSKEFSNEEKVKAINYLDKYLVLFYHMVDLDKRIGIKDNTGYKQTLEECTSQLLEIIDQTIIASDIKMEKVSKSLNRIMIYALIIVFVLSCLAGLYLSHKITHPISLLSTKLRTFVDSKFTSTESWSFVPRRDEIGTLIKNVLIVKNEITQHINKLEHLVAKRTEKVISQKEKIEQQNEEIHSQHEEVLRQKEWIEEQNRHFLESLRYAKNIQQALLPSQERLERHFHHSFVLYKPKSVVSGDFYWVKSYQDEQQDLELFIAADCTGHGVPGAFLSMLGISILNELIRRFTFENAGVFLNQLREKLIFALQEQSQNDLKDGMDISLCVHDKKNQQLQFAGANRNIYLIRNNEVHEYKGDRMPIGKYVVDDKLFTYQTIDLLQNDIIYAYSDGYPDQFNGQTGKKFFRKNFKKLLLEIHHLPLTEQKKILNQTIIEWQGSTTQTDDILVMGVQF